MASRWITESETPKQCKHVYKDGHQCPNFVYKLVPIKGFCQTHYARALRGKDMDAPMQRQRKGNEDPIVAVASLQTRDVIHAELERESGKYSLYSIITRLMEARFEDFGKTRNWRPVAEYQTTHRGHMVRLPQVKLPQSLAEVFRKYADATNRTTGQLAQDILEEWYADRTAARRELDMGREID